jgi:HAD superfamily hydrolase (TIGR01549 family)
MVRAVLFDLDDTLFDHRGCSRDALGAVRRYHESLDAMPLEELEQIHSTLLEQLHGDVMLGVVPLEDARRERFRRLLDAAGVRASDDLVEQTAVAYRDRYREVRRAVRGAAALLAVVRTRARVGIVSNNLFEEQLDKLRTCGLDPLIDALIVSERAGVSKPDPAIFAAALDRLQCRPDEAVMIGDSWAADIIGARAAGIRPIWFNPLGQPQEEGGATDQLQSLEPTAAVLEVIFRDAQPPTAASR